METRSEYIRTKLAHEYQSRCMRNPSYSLRAYAKSLGVSHSLLSLVLRGKRPPSRKFAALIDREKPYKKMPEKAYEPIATWMHFACLSLLTLPKFNPDKIAQSLNITPMQASLAWQDLIKGKFVKLVNGRWVQTDAQFTCSNKNSTDITRSFVRGYLKKADESLDNEPFEKRNLTTTTFIMNENDVGYAVDRIREFRRKLSEEPEARRAGNRVYALAVQLFPISQELK